MKRPQIPYGQESGFVLVTAMLLLVVLTVIGVAATQTSVFEILLASAERKKQAAFYAAEGGLEHGRVLVAPMLSGNIDQEEDSPKLTFLLDGSAGLNAATEADFGGGATLLDNQDIGDGYTYSVEIYDNNDGDGDPTSDLDGLVILGSRGQKPNGGASQVEIGLRAFTVITRAEEGTAVEGGGVSKNYNARDVDQVDAGTVKGNKTEINEQMGV
jgi:hypothetical protein